MGTDKQPQLTDVCHLCKKPFGMHSPIRQYCPRQEDPPFEEWKVFTFTPSPEPVAESEPTTNFIIETLGYAHEMIDARRSSNAAYHDLKLLRLRALVKAKEIVSEVSRLQSENKELKEKLDDARKAGDKSVN